MDKAEKLAYDRHIDAVMIQNDVLSTAKLEGHEEGHQLGPVSYTHLDVYKRQGCIQTSVISLHGSEDIARADTCFFTSCCIDVDRCV